MGNSCPSVAWVTTRIFRVRVSGQFDSITDSTRQFLLRSAVDHEPSSARFTDEPNLTYSPALDSFSVRMEVRVSDETAHAADPCLQAADEATREAERFLNVLSIPFRKLRATTTELT